MTTRRRGRGEGSVYLRPDGRWTGMVDGGWADGKRVRVTIYAKTRHAAQERVRAALTATEAGIRPTSARATLGDWLDEWLAGSVAARCRASTSASYSSVVRLHIQPALGRVRLAKLSPEDVGRFLADLEAAGTLSATTRRYTLTVLRIALNRALKSGRIGRNVAALVDPPARVAYQHRPLTAAEVGRFLEATTEDRLGPLYVVAIGTGLRQGEALALRWEDLDLEAGTLNVAHTLTIGTRRLAEPKTERSKRTLRLGTEVAGALREQRRRQLVERMRAGSSWAEGDFIFTTPLGTPLDASNVVHALQTALAAAGLPKQRWHDLRHACATLLIEAGEELAVVSKILGHSSLSTTADIYGHLTPAMAQRAADRLDGVLRWRAAATS